jgi:hypothetical protein
MRFLFPLVAAAMLAAAPAVAQELTEEQQLEASQFAINNSTFVIQHEIGHLFVAEFELPVLGKEEDAADSLATLFLLNQQSEEANQALIDSADGWYLMEYDSGAEEYEAADFYDEHSLSIQRAYQVVCFMVGADPEAFADVAAEYEIDDERQETCSFDYESAANSWTGLLEPNQGDGSGGGKIEVIYEPGGDYGDIEQMLKDVEFLEAAASSVQDGYNLPRDLTFRATTCGEENAHYSYEEGGITFCYEMVALFFRLIEDEMLNPEAAAE